MWFNSEYFGPNKTGNESEYQALLIGLEECALSLIRDVGVSLIQDLGIRSLLGKSSIPLRETSLCICGDSELVE